MSIIKIGFTDNRLWEDKEAHPQPMKNFAPEWYKNLNTNIKDTNAIFDRMSKAKTAKTCPSFMDIFKEGIVLIAHQDFIFRYDKKDNHYVWETATQVENEFCRYAVESHGNAQFVDHLPTASNIEFVLKFNMPYCLYTDKGYSSRQMPMPYYFNPDWHVSYGTLATDTIHEVNLQINITTADKDIIIKKGEPLCVYIPFKREEHKLETFNLYDKKYEKYLKLSRKSRYINRSKFRFGYKDLIK